MPELDYYVHFSDNVELSFNYYKYFELLQKHKNIQNIYLLKLSSIIFLLLLTFSGYIFILKIDYECLWSCFTTNNMCNNILYNSDYTKFRLFLFIMISLSFVINTISYVYEIIDFTRFYKFCKDYNISKFSNEALMDFNFYGLNYENYQKHKKLFEFIGSNKLYHYQSLFVKWFYNTVVGKTLLDNKSHSYVYNLIDKRLKNTIILLILMYPFLVIYFSINFLVYVLINLRDINMFGKHIFKDSKNEDNHMLEYINRYYEYKTYETRKYLYELGSLIVNYFIGLLLILGLFDRDLMNQRIIGISVLYYSFILGILYNFLKNPDINIEQIQVRLIDKYGDNYENIIDNLVTSRYKKILYEVFIVIIYPYVLYLNYRDKEYIINNLKQNIKYDLETQCYYI